MTTTGVEGYRLSPVQQRLWTLGGPDVRLTLRVDDVPDSAVLAALRRIADRHEILRTTFPVPAAMDMAVQVIGDEPAYRVERTRSGWEITLSPLAADAASLGVLARELGDELAGIAPVQPPQYADLAEWLHETLESGDDDAALGRAHWAAVAARCDRAGFAGPLVEPVRARAVLGAAVSARLGADAETVLLGCWQEVLRASTGRPDLVVGVAQDGRRHAELVRAIGPLTRHVPVRCVPQPDLSVALEVATRWQEHFDWDEFASAVGPDTTCFPALFDFADVSGAGAVTVTGVAADEDGAVRLSCLRRADDIVLTVHHEPAYAELWLERLQTVLAGRLAGLGDLEVVGEREHRTLLSFSGVAGDERTDTFHGLFAAQARRTPDRTALVAGQDRLTYAELDARSDRIAGCLRAQPDEAVGLCLAPSADLVAGLLGVLKAGGAYLPLDPALPAERIAFMLADAGVTQVLTDTALAPKFPDHDVVTVDDLPDRANPTAAATPANLAYVIYTSGSTGRPKGVQVEHRAVAHLETAMRQAIHRHHITGPADVAVNCALFFDASVQQLAFLLTGHTLHVLPDRTRQDDLLLVDYVRDHRIDVLNCTPSQLRPLLDGGLLDAAPALLLVAGEEMTPDQWTRLGDTTATAAYNIYGPTECTVNATAVRAGEGKPSIGGPLPGYQVFVMDERLRPAPVGAPGELYLGGPALARGYLRRAALTSTRFVPHPFGSGERLYVTGDRARWNPDGTLEFLGRADHQVKIRGHRVETGEVEAVLREHPEVRDAAVVVREDEQADRRLLAYVVGPPEGLREFLAERLPSYLVPSGFVAMTEFPRTSNGKLDRAALPAPGVRPPGTEYVPPASATERVLAEVWREVLGVEVGVEDNFFSAGGDSIRSIRVRVEAQRRGVRVSVQQMFDHQTVRALAAAVGPVADEDAPTAPFDLVSPRDREWLPDDVVDAYPPTMMQLGVLFHSELNPELPMFHNLHGAHLRAPLDVPALRTALAGLAERHPMLRTSFDLTTYSEPLQLVHRLAKVPLRVEDLRGLTEGQQRERLAEFTAAELRDRFDRTQAPLLRMAVHRRSDDTFQFTLTLHESVVDGWSVAALLTELFERYRAVLAGDATPADPLAATFRDYVAAERRGLADADSAEFWQAELSGMPTARLPAGDGGHRMIRVPVDTETSAGLWRVARAASVPLKSVLLAVHLHVVGELLGTPDVVTGLVANGRLETADGDRVLGQFLNTQPLRLDTRRASWPDLALAAFDAERRLLPHRRYPVARVEQDLGGRLFDTLFNFTRFHVYRGLRDVDVLDRQFTERMDVALAADFSVGGLDDSADPAIGLTMNCNGVDATRAEAIAARYASMLAAAAAGSELPEPAAVARAVGADGEIDGLLTDRFAARVLRTPDEVALVCGDVSLSYRELNTRANRVAHAVAAQGIGPEDVVALTLPRSADAVVALFGVLKSGAAALPIDPDQPAPRIAALLDDAQPALTLSALDRQASSRDDDPDVRPDPANAAYLLYTSGSTGRPKAVVVRHRGLANLFDDHAAVLFPGPERMRVALTASLAFDTAWEGLLAMVSGHELHLIGDDVRRDAGALVAHVREHRIDLLDVTPSYARLLLEAGLLDGPRPPRVLMLGGEDVPAPLWRAVASAPHTTGHNYYGPTEFTVDSHGREVAGDDPSIGAPIRNTAAAVLDSRLRPVPVGVAGELYLAGAGCARGYHRRSGLTAARFVPDPHADGGRMYRTGDLVRYRADGALEYLGRTDDQVQLRGFRVETGEVRARLAEQRCVREAAVVVRDGKLVGYVVGDVEPGELRDHVAAVLPGYMVPSAFVVLDELPLTGNGKLDVRALPAPAPAAGRDPRSRREERLCALFARVLGVDRVAVDSGFFESGGDSLLAIRLVGLVRAELGVDLPLRTLFDADSPAAMAAVLDRSASPDDGGVLVALKTTGALPSLFCVHPGVGLGWVYAGLRDHVGDRPLYGLQARGVDGPAELPADLWDMAADYVAEIRAVQPEGPYHLLGWSFGGLVAHAMADLLRQAGQKVSLLALLDAYPVTSGGQSPLAELFDDLGVSQEHTPSDRVSAARLLAERGPLSGMAESRVAAIVDVAVNNFALAAHRPGVHDGDILFFTAAHSSSPEAHQAWLPHVTGVLDNHSVDCAHADLARPESLVSIGSVLAAHLRKEPR
ncbi:hypothetical protein BLA60_12400 [Actinophytocola xinjiangensis]|uniref:Carrier domain-containing protein n=1 Tax=Actinophytocola xinjiangensis TaxID=485602 RepID=A0A7Z1AYI7_9PSEU|nr:non-ribosomal peptide synthetase [Actinophytocola xinjiangensis]OLF11716.1 hypothetical protein BLA60_12400 [Actinophytocola xinjiangensis]